MDAIFQKNKNLDVYFKTSDDRAFFTENAAKNHQKELDKASKKKGKVTKVTKTETPKASNQEKQEESNNKEQQNTKS